MPAASIYLHKSVQIHTYIQIIYIYYFVGDVPLCNAKINNNIRHRNANVAIVKGFKQTVLRLEFQAYSGVKYIFNYYKYSEDRNFANDDLKCLLFFRVKIILLIFIRSILCHK